ncbi:MAG: DNA-directed RNA polymerase subunit B [Nanoarchaeota archaeon]
MAEVYLNSKFVGTVEDADSFVDNFVTDRRKTKISSNVNIHFDRDNDQINIESSKGRLRRPLIVVKDGKSMFTEKHLTQLKKDEITWNDLFDQGVIEYLDASEEENALVAFSEGDLTSDHTHLEISSLAMFSFCTSLVPYGNHSPPARVNMGSKNQKQALGFYAANYLLRMDMDVNLLNSPQLPIVQSIMHEISQDDKHPAGTNLTVAVMSYMGYNMEDAIIVNRGSIDRGLARSTYYRPVSSEELRYSGGLIDEIGIPDKDVKGYRSEKDYRFIEEDGIIYPEAKVKEDDVIIGKTSPPRFLSGLDDYSLASNLRRESSSALQHGEKGIVDFVLLSENEDGNKLVQVRLRDPRIPEIGDKFTSRHGQKGIIGQIVEHADMPFSSSGVVPDLLFSPHGLPSRMSISHLIELLGGKVGSLAGRFINGTTFDSEPEEALRNELLQMGFREDGTETMYNGQTGEQYSVKIFVASQFYLKLKHMVANKIHSRARGPIQLLTRQPTEGRALEGGLRLGEMEKDSLVSHGASLLLKERFDSDTTNFPVCEECGLFAVYDELKKVSYCPVCGESVEVSNIEMSYAFKLLLDEFKSMGIYPKLNLKNKF